MVAQALEAATHRRLLRPGWPLYLVLVGFPLWWVMGLSGFIWQIVAVPMLLSLLRRKRVVAPPGFTLWVAFMLWMLATGIQLDSASRMIGFGYRASLYVSATIVLLYVYNSASEVLKTKQIVVMMSIFWIYVAIGGYLGLLMPTFSFASPVESIMPRFILANDFVKEMVHPAFAEVQEVLGYASPRPAAPFVYTNDWGGAFALLVPFVVLAWSLRVGRRLRMVLTVTAIAATAPVIISLNRGLWLSLGVGLVYAAFRLAMRGRERAMIAFLVVAIGIGGLVVFTPLKATLSERLANPHSNNRRVSLYEESIRGAIESPLFGFGAPRPSKWNPNAPSVGTQGQLWLVLFSHGIPGLGFFLAFFFFAFWRMRRTEPVVSFWMHVMLMIMFVQLAVYDFLPHQFHIVMIGVALGMRERSSLGRPASTLESYPERSLEAASV